MNIACAHLSLAPALTALGHMVLALRPPAGPVRIAPLLGDFVPELFIQQETLGPRTLFTDLPSLGCPKVFWSIDTHLNSFWQLPYARLFDLFCTTQRHWRDWFAERGVARTLWLPWCGVLRESAPWSSRRSGMVFVGRVTPERPVRGWFLDWLRESGEVEVRQDLGFEAMLELYGRSRIVPNEFIFEEVNFRLFEAASCACAVVNPAVPGVEELFLPGEEVALYRDGAELAWWVRRLLADDRLARGMGLRALARVRREHLPEHRARALLAAAAEMPRRAAEGQTADAALWLTVFELWESGRLVMPVEGMERKLARLPLTAEILAALLRLRARKGCGEFMRLAVPVAETGQYASSLEVNLAGSMGAVQCEDMTLARLFFLRHKRECAPGAADPGHAPLSICLAWAGELQRSGRPFRPGRVFTPGEDLPASALECLILASEHAPDDRGVYREMSRVLARHDGWDGLRLQVLSWLSLREPRDWRLGVELGVTDCRAFRVRQGLEELAAARLEAARQGQEVRFNRTLSAMDQSGRIRALLEPLTISAT